MAKTAAVMGTAPMEEGNAETFNVYIISLYAFTECRPLLDSKFDTVSGKTAPVVEIVTVTPPFKEVATFASILIESFTEENCLYMDMAVVAAFYQISVFSVVCTKYKFRRSLTKLVPKPIIKEINTTVCKYGV